MSRDKKSRHESRNISLQHAPSKSHGSTVLGIVIGVVIGVLIAFALVWYMNRATMPFQDKSGRTPADKTAAAAPAKPTPPAGTPGAATPEPLPGKPGDKPQEKPRFEFYNILPGKQDAAPEGQPAPQAATTQPAAPAADQTTYLQVGAFQKPADADNLKAKLALIGVEASVQQITIPDKGTLHRVRTGPYAKLDDMNKVRNLLNQNGIQATVVKAGN